jgi:hypothetical protein
MQLRVVFQGSWHSTQSEEELGATLGAAAAATHIEATLKAEGAAPLPRWADICADIPGRRITISIGVFLDTPVGSSVCFGPMTVSGKPVAGLLGPLVVEVRTVNFATTVCTIIL